VGDSLSLVELPFFAEAMSDYLEGPFEVAIRTEISFRRTLEI